jgi:hypothetical protein
MAQLRAEGLERVVFYGAGEVLEVVRPLAEAEGLRIVGVVDDDPNKQGRLGTVEVAPPESIVATEPDAVVITTFSHVSEIRSRLEAVGSPSVRVVAL